MLRLIRELRRREVFRTLGLYVGSCWLLIEVVSVVGPAFGGPQWLVRGIVIAAIVGFPVAGVLAWVYDLTKGGIARDRAVESEPVAPFGRKMDFAVIGLLSAALTVSVYLNITNLRGSGPDDTLAPISVLIADFANGTGDEIFNGLLEQALTIGIESAPHIMALERSAAAVTAAELQPDAGLRADAARLVAVREGVDFVLVGSIESSGDGFTLRVDGVDPVDGTPEFELSSSAPTRDTVLAAVGRLSEDVRATLGDTTLDGETATEESFTAASLEAAGAYVDASRLAFAGRHAEAMERYRTASELDPNLGRAYAGWAVSAFKVGQLTQAEALWDRALSHMDTMTERERLRTLGVYYHTITRNYQRAVETFSEL
ncbi:MAG TPA: tetratricopeptide repeat protein, partial [Gammaproteobacteria bacterium]|nr:tetratricopeptide repeat protein [Gammaproteobacteria bacterium]